MLSRVADSIYWLNRYVERAENVARFVEVNLTLLLDTPTATNYWQALVTTTGDSEFFQEHYGEPTSKNVLQFLTFDQNYSNSVVSCLKRARENAHAVRANISSEMWEQVNEFYHMVQGAASQPMTLEQRYQFYPAIRMASHLFAGIMEATMSHNEGWHFGQLGRFLERADKTARILDVKYFILLPSLQDVGSPLDNLQWIALLKSASAYEMYRKRQHRITPNNVAAFLILDEQFPRSICSSLMAAQKSLHYISGTPIGNWTCPSERSLGRLCSSLDYITMDEIFDQGLHEFLDDLQSKLNGVGQDIYEDFIAVPLAV
ncbi:MAG: alpha-E domain-containing protein [Synechococcus sp.]|nr:alpha-E domain-containing protein [Synechococcus sp.]